MMTRHFLYLTSLAIVLSACHSNRIDYEKVASCQDESVAQLEVAADADTRVLLIFPHADDEIVSAGLTSYLRAKGATIHLLTLGHHEKTKNNETRIEELRCAAHKMGVEDLEVAGLVSNTWENIMNDSIEFWYDHKDSVRSIISNKIDRFKPHILITYDAQIGGYGHPEHRISAQLTEEIFHVRKEDSLFAPERIYQFTLPDKLEDFILAEVPAYDFSRKLTGSDGLPEPEVALNIEDYWPVKSEVAQCHASQHRTLNKFYFVAPEDDFETHAKAFNMEYYTVVD